MSRRAECREIGSLGSEGVKRLSNTQVTIPTFIVVYIHMFRGLYYGSYASPREALWCIGVIILLLMIATAFIGYVLPWGQMSFWGATVITSLASAIPIVGDQIVTWLWGGVFSRQCHIK